MFSNVLHLLLLGLCVQGALVPDTHVGFNDAIIRKVEENMLEIAIHRWAEIVRRSADANTSASAGSWAQPAKP